MVYPELSRRFLIRPQEGNVELAATVSDNDAKS